MSQSRKLILGLAAVSLSFALASTALAVDAADETKQPTGQTEESATESAKMGKEEGTHAGDHQGAIPENDTSKIDQPDRRNPTTSNEGASSEQ
jgi:hypothetical protein